MPFTDKDREALEKVRDAFEAWWQAEGQFLDPDPRDLACMAFVAGVGAVGDPINYENLVPQKKPKPWHALTPFPYDYPYTPFLVAAADKETGEVSFFVCKVGDGGKFFPVRWGPQDARPGIEWVWLQENGWTPFAWSEGLPDFPQWPLPSVPGDLSETE